MDEQGQLYACRKDAEIRKGVRRAAMQSRGDGIDVAPFVFVVTRAFPAASAKPDEIMAAIAAYRR